MVKFSGRFATYREIFLDKARLYSIDESFPRGTAGRETLIKLSAFHKWSRTTTLDRVVT